MVVLTLGPQAVAAESLNQVGDESGGPLDDAPQQLFVLEPDGQRRERRVVPGLAVGESLVELTMRLAASHPQR